MELIKGVIYKCVASKGSIFKYSHSNIASHYIGNNLTSYSLNGGNFFMPLDYILAHDQEIAWLEACIKANKFIPFEEINKTLTYSIF